MVLRPVRSFDTGAHAGLIVTDVSGVAGTGAPSVFSKPGSLRAHVIQREFPVFQSAVLLFTSLQLRFGFCLF
jgi:hypothetical protein